MASCPGSRDRGRGIAVLVALFSSASLPAWAQGALGGVVWDPSGHVVPNAPVVVVEETTRHEGRTTSGPFGYYTIHDLPPGTYRVRVTMTRPDDQASFIFDEPGIRVIDGYVNGYDIYLKIVTTETHTVRKPAAPVSIETSIDGTTTFSQAAIEAMPLQHGRTLQSMLSVVPGIVMTESNGSLAQFTAAGQRRHSNRLTIDGVSGDLAAAVVVAGLEEGVSGVLPAFPVSGGTQTLVPVDAIEEIEVRTTSATPEHARAPGAQTSIVTRSGADRLSASGFVDARPSGLAATDYFENAGLSPLRKTNFWDTGASVGGPILPGRVFYFGTWQGQRIDRTMFATTPVPSLAVREAADEDLRPLLDAFPLPNGQEIEGEGEEAGLAEFTHAFAVPTSLSTVSLRFDANLPRQHRLFGRFNGGGSTGNPLSAGGPLPMSPSFTRTESTSTRTATVGVTSSSSSVTHEFRINVSTHGASLIDESAPYGGAGPMPFELLLPPGRSESGAYVSARLFNETSGTVTSGLGGGSAQRQFEIADTWGFARGRHHWRFGFDYRQLTLSTKTPADRYAYMFNELAQVLARQPLFVLVEHIEPARARLDRWSFFMQDTLRLSPRLSLDYGVRYSITPPPWSLTDLDPLLLRYETLPLLPERRPEPLPVGARLWKTSWTDLAPHVAATYQLRERAGYETTLRAGWRMVFDDRTSDAFTAFGGGAPYRSRHVFVPSSFPPPPSELAFLPAPLALDNRTDYFSVSDDFRSPRTYDWQVGIDQPLGDGQRVALTYAGAAGRDLIYWSGYWLDSRVPSTTSRINAFSNDGRSDYHALVGEYTRRLSRSTQARVAYTWSHAIDVDSGEPSSFGSGPALPIFRMPASSNRGPANYDRRHVLHASASYRLPTERLPGVIQSLCADVQIDFVGTFRSGAPVSVTASRNIGFGPYDLRPDLVDGVPVWIDDPTSPAGRRLNSDAFVRPIEPRQGTLGRNSLRAPTLHQVDLALSRSLRLGARAVAQLRLDAFNVFNVPALGPPFDRFGLTNFGQFYQSYADALGKGTLLGGGLPAIKQIGGPRSLQFGVRLSY